MAIIYGSRKPDQTSTLVCMLSAINNVDDDCIEQ